MVEVSKGRHTGTGATVEHLFHEWIIELERKGRSPNTIHGYKKSNERNIRASLGSKSVAKVSTKMLTDLYGAHQARGLRRRRCTRSLPLLDVHPGLPLGLARFQPRAVG